MTNNPVTVHLQPYTSPPQNRILTRVSTFLGRKRNSANEEEEFDHTSKVDSLLEEEMTSRVDSLYSSLQSRRSTYYSYQDTPAPLRTVQLENPTIHLPDNETIDNKMNEVEEEFKKLLTEYGPSEDHLGNVNKLTLAQKAILVRCSKSPAMVKKNSTYSLPSFSLKTFGLKNKSRGSLHDSFFHYDSETLSAQNTTKFKSSPARYSKSRTSILPNESSSSCGRASRSRTKSTPDYFVHLLNEMHVRDLEDSDVLDLWVFLRNVVASWTTEFLQQGGYEAIAKLFKQMKEAPKRCPNDDRMLQHLAKCLRVIMTHQTLGTQMVLSNPIALYHIRDILFSPVNKKQKQIYGLEIATRSVLLHIMCTLAILQIPQSSNTEYIHGYDVLRRLLLDKSTDNQHTQTVPFHMTLKTDPQEILQMIMQNDPNGTLIAEACPWPEDTLRPRYTAWMKELQCTTEQHIESLTFLSQLLNYDFHSAYRQIKVNQDAEQDEFTYALDMDAPNDVMTDEGVVEYIITHLRLIRTVVTTQPTSYTGVYDEKEQEKMRLELMLSGFDKISKMLLSCPHPSVRNSYMCYLKPLIQPCADLDKPKLPPRPIFEADPDDHSGYGVSIYATDQPEEIETLPVHRQWEYEEEPYDDIFQEDEFLEDHFNTDDESMMSVNTK
ncbi:armadillo-type protein [Pilobolus umbonatus]|nr:armadillo-type protein [Pilobolus umbonatus]